MSTAPHLWRKILEARQARRAARASSTRSAAARARVADEHLRPLPGTDAALALGMMRAIVDAGLADEEWCRAHADGYDELLERLAEHPVEHWAGELRRAGGRRSRAVARDFATTQPALLRLGVGAQRHAGAPIAYRTVACLPALVGRLAPRGGGFSYIPDRDGLGGRARRVRARTCAPGPVRSLNMSQLGEALDRPGARAAGRGAGRAGTRTRPRSLPTRSACCAGLRREDLFTVVLEQFMTDTARHADVVLPATTQLEHLDAVVLLGPPLPDLQRAGDRAARRGEAEHRDVPAAGGAARARRPRLPRDRRGDAGRGCSTASAEGATRAARARLAEARPRPGADAARRGRLRHAVRQARLRADWLARGVDPLPFFEPPAEVADAALAERFPLALITPKTHLFLNSTFANQRRQHSAQPEPFVVHPPRRRRARAGIADGDVVRGGQRPRLLRGAARVVRRRAPGRGWSRRWAGGTRDYAGGRSAQATTPQRLTDARRGPDVQRQPRRGAKPA